MFITIRENLLLRIVTILDNLLIDRENFTYGVSRNYHNHNVNSFYCSEDISIHLLTPLLQTP